MLSQKELLGYMKSQDGVDAFISCTQSSDQKATDGNKDLQTQVGSIQCTRLQGLNA